MQEIFSPLFYFDQKDSFFLKIVIILTIFSFSFPFLQVFIHFNSQSGRQSSIASSSLANARFSMRDT